MGETKREWKSTNWRKINHWQLKNLKLHSLFRKNINSLFYFYIFKNWPVNHDVSSYQHHWPSHPCKKENNINWNKLAWHTYKHIYITWDKHSVSHGDPYLRYKSLVLIEPRLSHGGFVVKTLSQQLQLLLTNQLLAQSHTPLMFRLLQLLPGLDRKWQNTV